MQQEGKLLSISEYARLRNLNKSTISRQIADGKIPTRDGRIDPVEADTARTRNLSSCKVEAATLRKRARAQASPRRARVEPYPVRAQNRALDLSVATAERAAPSVESVLRAILAWRDRLPGLFHRMGAPHGVALMSAEVLEALLLTVTGTMYGPIPGPMDFAAIAADLNIPEVELKSIYGSQCEPWSDALLSFFDGDLHCADELSPITDAGR